MSAPWGLMAEFATADALLAGARAVHAAGYRHAEAYSPFPVEGLPEALGFGRGSVAFWTFVGGLAGGAGGFFLQWYTAVIDYAIDVAGRPLNSWPMFMLVTFEMAVLGAAVCAVVSMLAGNGLPQLRHPVFNAPDFELAMRNRFFLCLPAHDPAFDRQGAERLLASLQPLRCVEVPA